MTPTEPRSAPPSPASTSSGRWLALCSLGLALAMWGLARPYRGIRHDGVFYVGAVLRRMMPARFGDDLFFAYGSQDRYSLFSPLFTPWVEHLGVGHAAWGALLACHVAFVLAVAALVRDWCGPARDPETSMLRMLVLLAAVLIPHAYGGRGMFGYAEEFLTARGVAEPLVIAALAAWLRGRTAAGWACVVAAALFHPLIALPGVIAGWLWHAGERRAWWWAGGAVAAIGALAGLAGVAPLDGLWHRYDPAWQSAVEQSNALVFISEQGLEDGVALLLDVAIVVLWLRTGPPARVARMGRVVLATAAVGALAWAIGTDLLHNVLLTQLQPWRAFWLLHLVAAVSAVPLLAHRFRLGAAGRWRAAALALAIVSVYENWPTGWATLLWVAAAEWAGAREGRVPDRTANAAAMASWLAVAVVTWRAAAHTLEAARFLSDEADWLVVTRVVVGQFAVASAIGMVLARALTRPRVAVRRAGMGALMACLVVGAVAWDARSDWQVWLERQATNGTPAFDQVVPRGASVFWHSDADLFLPWALGRRSTWFSRSQGAGVLFSRQTALEFDRRRAAVAPIQVQEELCQTVDALTVDSSAAPRSCRPGIDAVSTLCTVPGHPDYFVFEDRDAPDLPPLSRWRPPAGLRPPGQDGSPFALQIFRCADVPAPSATHTR